MNNCNYTVNGKLLCKEKFTNNSECSDEESNSWSTSNEDNLLAVSCILLEKYPVAAKTVIGEVDNCVGILSKLGINDEKKNEVLNTLSSELDDTSMSTIEKQLCGIIKSQNA